MYFPHFSIVVFRLKAFWVLIVLSSCILFSSNAQEQVCQLPEVVKEASALLKIKGHFLTVNDSGNEPKIYIFDSTGQITHQTWVKNATNWDWEALAYDNEKYLFIGDVGNNLNKRKNLVIYKVQLSSVLKEDTVEAEAIHFYYPEQTHFPPLEKTSFYYDAESLIYYKDSLTIFTKNRTIPFDGKTIIYRLPTKKGNYSAKKKGVIQLPETQWIEECITDASYSKNQLFLLTYAKIYHLHWKDNKWEIINHQLHSSLSQKEGIASDSNKIYIVDENGFGAFKHNYLYQIHRPLKRKTNKQQ